MSDKKKKAISPKSFLNKATSKKVMTNAQSVLGFLSQYREWLVSGELAPLTSPIIRKLDQGQAPSLTLKQVQDVVLSHIFAKEEEKFRAGLGKANASVSHDNWIATVYDANGQVATLPNRNGEEEDLVKSFSMSQDADRWTDRKLFDGGAGWYAIIEHKSINVSTRVERADAIARILANKKKPVMWQRSQNTSRLGFGMKVKESTAKFSQG